MLILKGKREEIIKILKTCPQNIKEIKILVKPSKKLFFYLLKYIKNLQTIYVSEGIYKTISKRVLNALEKASIKIFIFKSKVGRPEKFSSHQKNKALELLKQNLTAKEISKLTNLPISTIYFLRKKYKQILFS